MKLDPSYDPPGSPPVDRYAQRANAITAALDEPATQRLLAQAFRARTEAQRVVWLHRAQDRVGEAVQAAGVSPCREGCAHCCRIPVLVTAPEARAIGRATGRTPVASPAGAVMAKPGERLEAVQARLLEQRERLLGTVSGTPCPFLVDERCSVYNVRPSACRLHVSIDDTSDPCDTGPDGTRTVRAAYLNTHQHLAFAVAALGIHQPVADIRAFFRDAAGVHARGTGAAS